MAPERSATKTIAIQLGKTLYQKWHVDDDEAAAGMEAELVFYPNGNKVTRYRNPKMSVNWHYAKRPQVRQLSGLSPDRATKFSHPLGNKKNSGGKVTAKADKPVSKPVSGGIAKVTKKLTSMKVTIRKKRDPNAVLREVRK